MTPSISSSPQPVPSLSRPSTPVCPVRRRAPRGPQGLRLRGGSPEARRRAATILEVLAGVRTPTQAAAVLAISLPGYYAGEARALEGLLHACEHKPAGRSQPQRELAELRRRHARMERELVRYQTLLRAAHRTVGLAAPPPLPKPAPGKKRRRPPTARALQAAARLRAVPPCPSGETTPEAVPPSPAAGGGSG